MSLICSTPREPGLSPPDLLPCSQKSCKGHRSGVRHEGSEFKVRGQGSTPHGDTQVGGALGSEFRKGHRGGTGGQDVVSLPDTGYKVVRAKKYFPLSKI